MAQLILTDEQAKVVTSTRGPLSILGPSGNLIGIYEVEYTPAMIAEFKRRAAEPGPRYSGEQVQRRLKALQEEWDRLGGFGEPYMDEFLSRLDASDPPRMKS